MTSPAACLWGPRVGLARDSVNGMVQAAGPTQRSVCVEAVGGYSCRSPDGGGAVPHDSGG
jgi:hypothetical protein